MKYLKYILMPLIAVCLLSGCNDEDDIMAILDSGEWTLGNYFTGGDWDNVNKPGRPKYQPGEDLAAVNKLKITFNEDNTVELKLSKGVYSGKWHGDASGRTLRITDLATPHNLTGKDKEFVETLKLVRYYSGDWNYLKLGPEDKRTYMQLRHFKD